MSVYEDLAVQGFLCSLWLLSCLYCSPMQAHMGWLYSSILTDTTSWKFLYAWCLGMHVQCMFCFGTNIYNGIIKAGSTFPSSGCLLLKPTSVSETVMRV